MVKKTRCLGIDFGIKRIGLALSDESKLIAAAWKTVEAESRTDKTILKLLKLISDYEKEQDCKIEQLVIGLPLMMNGKKGSLADTVQDFIEKLKNSTEIPVITWDERLTTVQADRILREATLSRKKRSKVVDALTALIILQSYLDFRSC